jgi:hypothetical protein
MILEKLLYILIIPSHLRPRNLVTSPLNQCIFEAKWHSLHSEVMDFTLLSK